MVNGQPYTGQNVLGSHIVHAQWMAGPEDLMGGFAAIVIDIDHGDYLPGSFYIQDGFITQTMDVISPVANDYLFRLEMTSSMLSGR